MPTAGTAVLGLGRMMLPRWHDGVLAVALVHCVSEWSVIGGSNGFLLRCSGRWAR
jgi:hypothetical protein